jgi:hypothetical protein
MLPHYISKDGTRDTAYNRNTDLYFADHYKIFNTDEARFAVNKEDYICFDLLRYAVDTLVDGTWLYTPTIDFDDDEINEVWEKLRRESDFDEEMKKATRMMLYLGDAPIKTIVDENVATASPEDYKICIYSFSPVNWHPDYEYYNTERPAKKDTIVTIKDLEDGDKVYLLESFTPGLITYTAYLERKNMDNIDDVMQSIQVPPMQYFSEELYGILANSKSTEDDLEITYETETEYSLLQVIQNYKKPDSYFGESLFNWSVVSKINAINKYSNLSDHVIVNNSIPKLELSAKAGQLLDQAIQEVIGGTYGNNTVKNEGEVMPTTFDRPVDKTFLNRSSYLRSSIISSVIQKLEVFEGDGRGSTRYITNDFDLSQLREAQDKLIDSLMSELGIATILYKQDVSTGTLSGIAYERLMTTTLNKIGNIQNLLEDKVKIIAFTIMQLASTINYDGLEGKEIPTPTVQFHEAVKEDTKENLENWVIRTQNKFSPLIDAVKDINNVDEETAQEMIDEMNQVSEENPVKQAESILTQDKAVNQNMIAVRDNLKNKITQSVNGGATT